MLTTLIRPPNRTRNSNGRNISRKVAKALGNPQVNFAPLRESLKDSNQLSMSSVVDPQPEQPAAEELVAYLDGELPPDDCRRIEERLAADPNYRQQLRELDQAWEALDALPARKAEGDFARTTMELVTVAAHADAAVVTATAAGAKRGRMARFAGAALAGILLGFVMARLLLPNQNQTLLSDLPVIRRADTLRQVENVEFLRRLAAEVPPEELMNDEVAIDDDVQQMASLESRRQWVHGLPSEDRIVLAARAKEFTNLDDDKKEQLRELHEDIIAGGLEPQLLAYDQWLSRLTAGQQEELRQRLLDLPVVEQVEYVRRSLQQESEQAARRLSPDDAQTLRNNLHAIAAERKLELFAPRQERGDGGRARRPLALTQIARELFRYGESRQELQQQLMSGLSPKARTHLDSLSGGRRNGQLWRWILDSLPTKVDSDELERFFAEKLNNDQREQLLSLPPSEMQARLERLYYASELGYRDVGEWWSQIRESGWPSNRPDGDRRGFRPGGPPGERGRREGPQDFLDRERMPQEPGGPPPDARRPRGPGEGPPPQQPLGEL
jgi:hypothetical protein